MGQDWGVALGCRAGASGLADESQLAQGHTLFRQG